MAGLWTLWTIPITDGAGVARNTPIAVEVAILPSDCGALTTRPLVQWDSASTAKKIVGIWELIMMNVFRLSWSTNQGP